MDECSLHRLEQVAFVRHVHDRVVDENGVEEPVQPQRPHIAGDMLASRIEATAQIEHTFRHVGKRQLEMRLQV